MNILVSGSSGFVGKNLCNHLIKKNNVVGIYNKNKNNSIIDKIKLDLCKNLKTSYLKKIFIGQKIDIIIHLAGLLANKKNIKNFNLFQNNIKITKNLINISEIIKPKKFINFSSMAIYPNINGIFDEKYKFLLNTNTDFLYGFSKYCSEILFENYLNKSKKINLVHLRVSQIYGKGMNQSRIIPIMKKELKSINSITVFGNGLRISNFIHIDRLKNYMDFILSQNLKGVYNIGDENISYLNLAKKIIKDDGNKKSIIFKINEGNRNKFILNTNKFNKIYKKYD
jgi:nucleoside-diphosphate-sugar epimerase|tara:strand:- start:24 stop:872 length:849 start_codon:yes stop_codon:yes gene_type:complete